MVDLEPIDPRSEDAAELRKMIKRHVEVTGSEMAAHVLAEFDTLLPQFVRVMPVEYRRVLEQRRTIADDMASRREVEKQN
jgi:glutamate synthase domain-containing protein 3